ncbi:ArsR family transcriptional regulator [Nonomuraea typhae]|uniref:ArsR family transcriptional regulator n=1 Tax=Nonomuraea typhae TaxID=2603600 RepID=UPI001FE8DC50|nr:ArsR family transcriptional regulator [Nonomuraea typhae]
MADPVRLQILSLVLAHADGEACVCDISAAFDFEDARNEIGARWNPPFERLPLSRSPAARGAAGLRL